MRSGFTYGSRRRIELKCDYCEKTFTREYRRQIEVENNNNTGKEFCSKCLKFKNLDEFLIKIRNKQREEILGIFKNNNYKVSGVYGIRNKNNKTYIGSSSDVINRWKHHINEMNTGTHYVKEFNNIETSDIEFFLINHIQDKDSLIHIEYKLIQIFKTYDRNFGYNTSRRKTGFKNRVSRKNAKASALKRRENISKLTIEDVKIIKKMMHSGIRLSEINNKFPHVDYSTIQSIKSLSTWSDISPELNSKIRNIKYKDVYKGENNGCSKLSIEEVREIKKLLFEGERTLTSIGNQFNVSRTLISHIKKGKLWSHVS